MSESVSPLVTGIGWTLIHFLWQGLLLGSATALALAMMRNARPQQRYLVACTALFMCVAWPAFDLMVRLQASDSSVAELGFMIRLVPGAMADDAWLPYLQHNLIWIVALWGACALVLALRMVLGLLWVRHAVAHHSGDAHWQAQLTQLAGRFAIGRPVRLRVIEHLASPVTAGWWRPVVLVPASLLTGMAPHLLEALLAHEMAHVKRHDYLVNLAQNLVETLLFYHPTVWWISGQVRIEREQIADDIAASILGEPRRLALALSELERIQFSPQHLAMAANGGNLMNRIQRLLRPTTHTLNWKAALPVLGLAAACLAVVVNAAPGGPQAHNLPARADFTSCPSPQYPTASLKAEHTGVVALNFLIGKNGEVVDSNVDKSSGHVLLDQAAREGISRCQFVPAHNNGQAVETWLKMQYVWTLK
jgi:D-alanyl-D-alanine endopeptidase (penicillin-binding protein 7)